MGGMKLYRFTMIDNEQVVRDFIPCRRRNDSKVGLLDLINNIFYTTPTGDFEAGAMINTIKTQFMSNKHLYAR
jgi:hypothetical protein